MALQPFLSIVIPVYNGGAALQECLYAIKSSLHEGWEFIVIDDGSTDRSATVAEEFGATVLQTPRRLGSGAARNLGAQVAKGEYLCFIDADCEVHSDTLKTLSQVLRERPDVDAVFGSYDDAPKAPNFVAQYKNLLHHYVHQGGNEEAFTFWAGCGAIKRSRFLSLNGFDTQRFQRPSIEDIDLGYRIKQAGGRIYLAKQVQVKHHKAWSLTNLIKTDVFDRGIPWTRLLLSKPWGLINDLNLTHSSKISVVATYLLLFFLLASFYKLKNTFLMLFPLTLLLIFNWQVYSFFYKKRGLVFSLRAIFMHWLYYFYSGISLMVGVLLHWQNEIAAKSNSDQFDKEPLPDSVKSRC